MLSSPIAEAMSVNEPRREDEQSKNEVSGLTPINCLAIVNQELFAVTRTERLDMKTYHLLVQ
jgi:hypothetical protein